MQLIKPEEMCNPKVDELSMMTYLSQFPHAKLKTGAPLRPRTNPAKVRAYGPGNIIIYFARLKLNVICTCYAALKIIRLEFRQYL